MLSLTDMWKAAGEPETKRPAEWLRQDSTKDFIEIVMVSNVGQNHISTRRGNNGGTFAHWQIGLAYAKYLSPEFHMWCNEVVRERPGRTFRENRERFVEGEDFATLNQPDEIRTLGFTRPQGGTPATVIHHASRLSEAREAAHR
ncbi:KilA domain-containing protein [Ancylobacter aquaticus]|uniref:KilA domain-containing protein n=1 Tax=Ancylobacter aquaticus TaxID=100 RepID=A0A4R1I4P6_ANCAQ|nr:KilA domain-containing protein [Ancylobacter aquaticus]